MFERCVIDCVFFLFSFWGLGGGSEDCRLLVVVGCDKKKVMGVVISLLYMDCSIGIHP